MRLPDLERYFKQILQGKGDTPPPPPPPDDRPLRIHISDQRPEVDPGHPDLIRMRATIAFAMSPDAEEDAAEVELSVRYVFMEDGRVGDPCPLTIDAPEGFSAVEDKPGTYGCPLQGGDRIQGRVGSVRPGLERCSPGQWRSVD